MAKNAVTWKIIYKYGNITKVPPFLTPLRSKNAETTRWSTNVYETRQKWILSAVRVVIQFPDAVISTKGKVQSCFVNKQKGR